MDARHQDARPQCEQCTISVAGRRLTHGHEGIVGKKSRGQSAPQRLSTGEINTRDNRQADPCDLGTFLLVLINTSESESNTIN